MMAPPREMGGRADSGAAGRLGAAECRRLAGCPIRRRPAAGCDAVPPIAFEDRAEGRLHVPDLIQLVVAPLPVEPQHRDAPAILHLRIDLAEGLLVRDHLAAARQADRRAVLVADRLLHREAVAFGAVDDAGERADARHAVAAADFDVVAARESSSFACPTATTARRDGRRSRRSCSAACPTSAGTIADMLEPTVSIR